MEKEIEQFFKDMRTLSMEERERSAMRDTLRSYVDANPLHTGVPTYPELAPVQLWFTRFIESKKATYVTVPLALILFLGGGITAAAHDALPGDTLYPVKVGFNEEVRSVLAFTAEAEAKWNAERAERRLEEAETLAVAGKLDMGTRVYLEEKFEEYVGESEQQAVAISQKGKHDTAFEVQSDLETRIHAHADVLESISTNGEVTALIQTVRNRAVSVSLARMVDEPAVHASVSATVEQHIQNAEEAIEEVYEELENLGTIDPGVRADAEARAAHAEDILTDARVSFEVDKTESAITHAQKTLRVARGALIVLRQSTALGVEIHVDVVPTTTTADEHQNGTEEISDDTVPAIEPGVEVETMEVLPESAGNVQGVRTDKGNQTKKVEKGVDNPDGENDIIEVDTGS